MSKFVQRRQEVIDFMANRMMQQGASQLDASLATVCVNFWKQSDVENLYRCINSDLSPETIDEIVAHDYNGLSKQSVGFSPKSSQFAIKEIA